MQKCLKLDQDIQLVMLNIRDLPAPFRRTVSTTFSQSYEKAEFFSLCHQVQDDNYAVFVPKTRDPDEKCIRVTREKLNILIETFYKEVEKLRDLAIQVAF